MGNRITRTVLFAAFALLSINAFGAGAARFGTLRNSDWVVTNAWQAVSNKTHDLILEIGQSDSMTGIVDRALSYGTENYWTDATGIVWVIVGSTTNIVGRIALTNDIPDSVSADLTPATNYTNQVAEEFEDGTRIVREAEIAGNAALATNAESADYAIAADGLIGHGVTYAWFDFFRQSTNAAIAVADAKISTNNPAFVSAVLAAPLVGADPSDLSEIAEYGSYSTVGAAILALIAGLAALKRRMTAAETALSGKADTADLPYAFVTPVWSLPGSAFPFAAPSNFPSATVDGVVVSAGVYISDVQEEDSINGGICKAMTDSYDLCQFGPDGSLVYSYPDVSFDSTPSLVSSLLLVDRAVNAVPVSTDTTLTLPELVNVGKARDFLVRLAISGSTVPTITFSPDGNESVTYETDGDEFPVPDAEGTWLYSFTETAAHKFAVSLKKVNEVLQGGS